MKRVRHILVAIKDPDADLLPALGKAYQLAKTFGASVELYHAITTPVYMGFELTDNMLRELQQNRLDECRRRLESLAERGQDRGLLVTVSVAWDFPAHEAIVRRAARIKADLIVAECHAGRRLTPWLLHLTDWELLRTSPVPVLLVKNKHLYERPIVLTAIDPTHVHAKPAKLDQEILSAGTRMAAALSGSLHAMHAYFPVPLDVPTSQSLTDESSAHLYQRVRTKARVSFERLMHKARISRARRHLVDRNPTDAIPATAKEIAADLLVMGAVSRSGLKRIFIGNTAERVLGAVSCDVLVIKPRHFAKRVPGRQRGVRLIPQHIPFGY